LGGCALKDFLNNAGIKAGSVDISFDGLDLPLWLLVPEFGQSLPSTKRSNDDIMSALEMNGTALADAERIPRSAYSLGWYATYLGEVFKRDNGAGEAV